MRPPGQRGWTLPLWILWFLLVEASQSVIAVSSKEQRRLQEETRALWNHGYTNYMAFAYPEDELKPLSCRGQGRDHANPGNYGRNDVNGDYSLTYLDLLSTMPLMRGEAEFEKAIDRVLSDILNFDRDVKVQVFEVTIRILGSLLSSYQQLVEIEERRHVAKRASSLQTSWGTPFRLPTSDFLSSVIDGSLFSGKAPSRVEDASMGTGGTAPIDTEPRWTPKRMALDDYRPSTRARRLLALAIDLGDRLLPAFDSPTGLPFARINLGRGIDQDETEETCAAATGSLTLEFTLLSQLTGNKAYERVARESFMNTWSRRTPTTGLLGNTIGVRHGRWMMPGASGIGAGIDSFYEYALKGAILFDNDAYMGVWDDSYRSVMQHVRSSDQHLFRNVQMNTGQPVGTMLDSLSAFWPGLQVLAGDVESAIKSHLLYWHLWQKHSSLPEGFNYVNKTVAWSGYPLRPEFIESTYWLFRATKDSFYLEVGKRILKDLTKRTKVRCGFAVLHNIHTGAKEDRMESFMLSETLKYLYLLFDEKNPVNTDLKGTVFTTEGHILKLPRASRGHVSDNEKARRRTEFAGSDVTCPVPAGSTLGGLRVGIKSRPDYDYARTLVDMPLVEKDYWDLFGQCLLPQPGFHHFEIALVAHNESSSVISHTAADKEAAQSRWDERIFRQSGDLVINDARGIHAFLTRVGDAFEVTSVGNHRVQAGQYVYIQDPLVLASTSREGDAAREQYGSELEAAQQDRLAEIRVRITSGLLNDKARTVVWEGLGATAIFGRPISVETTPDAGVQSDLLGLSLEPLVLVLPGADRLGCSPESYQGQDAAFVAFPQRGDCTFREKLDVARQAGASGVVVWGNDNDPLLIRPADDTVAQTVKDQKAGATSEQIAMVYVSKQAGLAVEAALNRGEAVYVELPADTEEFHDEMNALISQAVVDSGNKLARSPEDQAEWERVIATISQLLDEAGIDTAARLDVDEQARRSHAPQRPHDDNQEVSREQQMEDRAARSNRRSRFVNEAPRRDLDVPPLMIAGLPIRNVMLRPADSPHD